MSVSILPTKADRPRLARWIFFIAWFIGASALAGGSHGLEGFLENAFALCVFAIACATWWGAYKVSNFRSRGGFIVIALWAVGRTSALFDLRDHIRNPFSWGSAVMLTFLFAAAAFARPRGDS